jgi:hypothetical protein
MVAILFLGVGSSNLPPVASKMVWPRLDQASRVANRKGERGCILPNFINMKRITVIMPDEVYEKVIDAANVDRRTKSAMCVKAIEEGLVSIHFKQNFKANPISGNQVLDGMPPVPRSLAVFNQTPATGELMIFTDSLHGIKAVASGKSEALKVIHKVCEEAGKEFPTIDMIRIEP